MKKNNEYNAPVVVLGLTANGLSVIRSLARRDIGVIGCDNHKHCGYFSRYLKARHILSNVKDNPEQFKSDILRIGRELGRAFLFPTSDEYIKFISLNRNELKEYFDFALPDADTVAIFLNKQKTVEFAFKQGIRCPQTMMLSDASTVHQDVENLKYPCFMKPAVSYLWAQKFDGRKGFIVNNREELLRIWKEHGHIAGGFAVQQIICGPDSNIYTFDVLCNKAGEEVFSVCTHKLRQYPPHFGIGCFAEVAEQNSRIIEAGRKALGVIKYYGLISFEFKLDPDGGEPFLMEANLRTAFNGELRVKAGADLPYFIYKYFVIGEVGRPDIKLKYSKFMNFELDLGCFYQMHRDKEITFWKWIKSYWPIPNAHAYFAWDDLMPWVKVYSNFLKVIFKKIFRIK
ncbi:MAG: hypothetical protein HQL25_04660 [Candidatus Omnitrophica bacterium]|nr:hypothetical protein [Candidatus Omnitrophota bacterium]